MYRVAILTNIVPKYRHGFYQNLFSSEVYDIHVFCQREIKGGNYETIHHLYRENIHEVKHRSLKNESVSYQLFPWYSIFKNFDIIYIDGNPRNISHALFATLLRVLGKKVVIWSMFHSFKNNKRTENIRHNWLRFFKYHFLYNDNDILALKKLDGFKNKIVSAMNNGLDQNNIDNERIKWDFDRLNKWRVAQFGSQNKIDIVTLGRLAYGKYEILLDALELLRDKGIDASCCIIGTGPALSSLRLLVADKKLESLVYFVGAIHDDEILAPFLLSGRMLVHPTAVGLSIMHCFGYGLPIITHDNFELHGPEIIAFEKDVNGLTYKYNDSADLAIKIECLLNSEKSLKEFSDKALFCVRNKFNTKVMAERFLAMTETVINDI